MDDWGENWSPGSGEDLPEGVSPDYDDWLPDLPLWMDDGVLPKFGQAPNQGSPLVLDLGTAGIELTSVNGPDSVYWDIDQDGMAESSIEERDRDYVGIYAPFWNCTIYA